MHAIPNARSVNESQCLALFMSHCRGFRPQAVASPKLVSLSDHWPFFLSGLPSSHALLALAALLLMQTLVILWNPHEHLGWACPASVAFGSFCVLLYHPPSSLLFACHPQLAQWSNKSAALYFSWGNQRADRYLWAVISLSIEKFIINICWWQCLLKNQCCVGNRQLKWKSVRANWDFWDRMFGLVTHA